MVTSLNQAGSARDIGYNVVEHIGGRIQANAAGTTVAVKLGKIPPGAVVLGVGSRVATAITGGTPVLSVGTLGDAGLDNVVATMAEAAGSEWLLPLPGPGFVNPSTTETELWASIAGGATAGDAYVLVVFCRPQLG